MSMRWASIVKKQPFVCVADPALPPGLLRLPRALLAHEILARVVGERRGCGALRLACRATKAAHDDLVTSLVLDEPEGHDDESALDDCTCDAYEYSLPRPGREVPVRHKVCNGCACKRTVQRLIASCPRITRVRLIRGRGWCGVDRNPHIHPALVDVLALHTLFLS